MTRIDLLGLLPVKPLQESFDFGGQGLIQIFEVADFKLRCANLFLRSLDLVMRRGKFFFESLYLLVQFGGVLMRTGMHAAYNITSLPIINE